MYVGLVRCCAIVTYLVHNSVIAALTLLDDRFEEVRIVLTYSPSVYCTVVQCCTVHVAGQSVN